MAHLHQGLQRTKISDTLNQDAKMGNLPYLSSLNPHFQFNRNLTYVAKYIETFIKPRIGAAFHDRFSTNLT